MKDQTNLSPSGSYLKLSLDGEEMVLDIGPLREMKLPAADKCRLIMTGLDGSERSIQMVFGRFYYGGVWYENASLTSELNGNQGIEDFDPLLAEWSKTSTKKHYAAKAANNPHDTVETTL